MSETDCPDCMLLGQQLEAAQLEIRRLEADVLAIEKRHRQHIDELERDHRDDLQCAAADGYQEGLDESRYDRL